MAKHKLSDRSKKTGKNRLSDDLKADLDRIRCTVTDPSGLTEGGKFHERGDEVDLPVGRFTYLNRAGSVQPTADVGGNDRGA